MTSDRLHPRPQLTRDAWIDLDGEWGFASDPDDRGLVEGWWRRAEPFDRTILVPFPPESAASGIEEPLQRIVWYRREIGPLDVPDGHRVLLHLTAVDHLADVWVDGQHVARHEGGHTSFSIDITRAVTPDRPVALVVRALDEPSALDQPRGKQDWEDEPHTIWYRRTTGIWRQVWAEVVPSSYVDELRWTPLDRPGQVRVEVGVAGHVVDSLEVDVALSWEGAPGHRTSLEVHGGRASAVLDLRDPRFDTEPHRLLWTPESPTLLRGEVRLRRDDVVVDRVGTYVGLRTVGTHGRSILLNQRPYHLRLVLEQAFWPQTHLAAPSDEALSDEVRLIKSLGFNGLRMHQTVADPRFLYECDRQGLVVWADAPAAYRFSPTALSRTVAEWMEIVRRDASHPSVIAWVAFNESWGVPDVETDADQQHAVRAVTHLLKALDPTRLVIGNDGWEYVAGDLLGVHDYTQDPAVVEARYGTQERTEATVRSGRPGARRLTVAGEAPKVPVVLSEFGGTTFSEQSSWEGYGHVDELEEFLDRVGQLVRAVAAADGLAGWCYTQLTDTLQERNGLLDEHRVPKAPVERLREIIAG